jgi:cbb3-type cytochrome oxidase subunit 3
MLVGYSVKLAMVVVLYIYMYRVNKARDAEQAARGELTEEEEKEAIERGMLDMTEIDNKGFRYIL